MATARGETTDAPTDGCRRAPAPDDTPAGVVLATGDAAAGRAIVAPDPRDAIEPPTPAIVADEVQTQAEQVDSLDARANFMLMEGSFAFLIVTYLQGPGLPLIPTDLRTHEHQWQFIGLLLRAIGLVPYLIALGVGLFLHWSDEASRPRRFDVYRHAQRVGFDRLIPQTVREREDKLAGAFVINLETLDKKRARVGTVAAFLGIALVYEAIILIAIWVLRMRVGLPV